jgi:hypothetical protein
VGAIAVIVFTPTPLLADAAEPWVFSAGGPLTTAWAMMVLGLIPVVLIEGFILRQTLGITGVRAYATAAKANAASTLAGLVPLFVLPYDWAWRGHRHFDDFYHYAWFSAFAFCLLFAISWAIEASSADLRP